MEKINIDNLIKFSSAKEAFDYIKFLGGEIIIIEDLKNKGFDEAEYTQCILNGMMLKYNKTSNVLKIINDPIIQLDEDQYALVEEVGKHPYFGDCYDGKYILSLEGLVYLHSLASHGDQEIDIYYTNSMYELLTAKLDEALFNSERDMKEIPTKYNEYEIKGTKKYLNRLKQSIMPPKSGIHKDYLIGYTVFNSPGLYRDRVDNRKHYDFYWRPKDNKSFNCEFHQGESHETYIVNVEPNGHNYYFKYTITSSMETISIYTEHYSRDINLTYGTYFQDRTLKNMEGLDYLELTRIIKEFADVIWNVLPLIKDQIEINEQEITGPTKKRNSN